MTTMRDIARITGLSIGTISRYINRSDYVSEKSQKIIQKAIEESKYVPNRNAISIFTNNSSTIGVVAPSLVNPFFSHWVTQLGRRIQSIDYGFLLYFTEDSDELERKAMIQLKGYRVDGIIIARANVPEIWEELGIPVVSFENSIPYEVANVKADNYSGGVIALNHLLDRGVKRLVHITGPSCFSAILERRRGFVEEAERRGFEVVQIYLEGDYQLGNALIERDVKFRFQKGDGVFAFNDMACLPVIRSIQKQGLRIPEDVKVIGFDNNFISGFYDPPITTIEQNVLLCADKCFDVLMQQLEKPEEGTKEFLIPVELVARKSTA